MTVLARSHSDPNTAVSADCKSTGLEAAHDEPRAAEGKIVVYPSNALTSCRSAVAIRATLGPADRDTFDIWARRVAAAYCLIAIVLVTGLYLGGHRPAGQGGLSAPQPFERSTAASSAVVARSAGR
jgi:hypothetical protein